MKRAYVALAVVLTLVVTLPVLAQEKAAQISPEQQAAKDAWMKVAAPGAQHQRLAQLEGTWTASTKMWMAPGAPAEVSAGTATYKMILGGRYLREKVEAQMMGMPFEGFGYTGYDNLQGAYVASWVDNFGTGIMISQGSWDDATSSLVMTGEAPDPVSGKSITMRMVTRIVDANTHIAEFYQPGPDGQEFKGMEITYTRSAPAEKVKKKDKGKR
jgi:hypothetical protein